MDFIAKLEVRWRTNDTLLCVGVDPDKSKLPKSLSGSEEPLFEFSKAIVNATFEEVCAFKINPAFFEAEGSKGIEQLKKTADYIKSTYPDIPLILDFKRGDIGNTNEAYAAFGFDYVGADAVTVQPWAGKESLEPFLNRKEKGIIVLVRTSNPGAGELQDIKIEGEPLYFKLAALVKEDWNYNHNCLLVIGATYSEQLAEIRSLTGDEFVFLVPGLGAQGGDVNSFVKAGLNSSGTGLIINASRSIIFASSGEDFAAAAKTAAQEHKQQINKARS